MPRGAYAPRSCVGVRMSAGEIAICAMHKRTSAAAAGVSPPWFGSRTCNGDRSSWSDYVHHARSDGAPRLAYASRSWCATPVRRKKRHSRCSNARSAGAAGVSPPWLGKRTCQYASAKSRESVNGAMTNPGAVAVANPWGAYAPRSWCSCGADICRRNCDLCDTRTLVYKSGGCQPAVGRKPRLQMRSVFVE
jgi:hypothetical protein